VVSPCLWHGDRGGGGGGGGGPRRGGGGGGGGGCGAAGGGRAPRPGARPPDPRLVVCFFAFWEPHQEPHQDQVRRCGWMNTGGWPEGGGDGLFSEHSFRIHQIEDLRSGAIPYPALCLTGQPIRDKRNNRLPAGRGPSAISLVPAVPARFRARAARDGSGTKLCTGVADQQMGVDPDDRSVPAVVHFSLCRMWSTYGET
jgi:hypothetical protein